MSTTAAALARRAVACSGWRWMPGMSDGEDRVVSVDATTLHIVSIEGGMDDWCSHRAMDPPDLSDPATLGCFEHGLLAEAWYADAHLDAFSGRDGETLWCVVYRPDPVSLPNQWLSAAETGAPTKAEALVAALEAAPS